MFFRVILGPFLIFGLIYLILSAVALVRMINIFQAKSTVQLGVIFYVILLIHSLFRASSSTFLTILSFSIELHQNYLGLDSFSKLFINILYVPDILFCVGFLLLLWQLLILFKKGHLSSQNSLSPTHYYQNGYKDLTSHIFISVILVSTITQMIIICLYNLEFLNVFTFLFENAIYNLVIPFILLISELILHIQFSGIPYKSIFDMENKAKINKRILFWGITRSIHGAFDIILSASQKPDCFHKEINHLSVDEQLSSIIFVVIILAGKIITEVIPFILVLDYDFITVFFKSPFTMQLNDLEINLIEQDNNNYKKIGSNNNNMEQNSNLSQGSNSFNTKNNIPNLNYDELDINVKKIYFNSILFDEINKEKKRVGGLGKIRLGFLNKDKSQKICVRSIEISKQKFSKYIIEEIMKDMKRQLTLQTIYRGTFVKFRGYSFGNETEILYLFYNFEINGSLFNILFGDRKNMNSNMLKMESFSEPDQEESQLSLTETIKTAPQNSRFPIFNYDFKLKLIFQIAKILNNLHSADPPLVHGHLNLHNILFNSKFEPIISDFGFSGLKKFCKIMFGYSNKSEYTAPEYLSEKGLIVDNPRPPSDVYSFGIIFWELMTEQKAFRNFSREDLIKKVVEEKVRPKIPENIPAEITLIIRACWQNEENKRPGFGIVLKLLEEIRL